MCVCVCVCVCVTISYLYNMHIFIYKDALKNGSFSFLFHIVNTPIHINVRVCIKGSFTSNIT